MTGSNPTGAETADGSLHSTSNFSFEYMRNLSHKLELLVNNPLLSDVVFLVENQRVFAHRCILSASSDPFKAMFSSGMSESNKTEIVIPNYRAKTFIELLRFIYSGISELGTCIDDVLDLLFAASQYDVPELKNTCALHIVSLLDTDNVFTFLETARTLGAKELIDSSLQFIEHNTKEAIANESFLTVSDDTLRAVLESDQLLIEEDELFMRVVEWGKAKFETDGEPVPTELLKAKLEPFMNLIRFPVMKADTLCDVVEPLGIVPQKLLLEAYKIISLKHRKDEFNSNKCIQRGKILFRLEPSKCHSKLLLSNNNLTVTKIDDNYTRSVLGDRLFTSGVHYWEVKINTTTDGTILIGVAHSDYSKLSSYYSKNIHERGKKNLMYYCKTGSKYEDNVASDYGFETTAGDVVGVLLDLDNRKLTFYKNGVSQGVAFSGDVLSVVKPNNSVENDSLNNAILSGNTGFYPLIALATERDEVTLISNPLNIPSV